MLSRCPAAIAIRPLSRWGLGRSRGALSLANRPVGCAFLPERFSTQVGSLSCQYSHQGWRGAPVGTLAVAVSPGAENE
jgi:hypothetical protein